MPNSRRSTLAPDSNTSLASTTPSAERGHEQQRGGGLGLPAGPARAAHAAGVAERHRQREQRGADAGRVGGHEPREGGRSHRVGVEREPPEDDPGAHQPAGQREQHDLDQRLAQERQLEEVDRRGHRQEPKRESFSIRRGRAALRTNRRDTAWSSMIVLQRAVVPARQQEQALGLVGGGEQLLAHGVGHLLVAARVQEQQAGVGPQAPPRRRYRSSDSSHASVAATSQRKRSGPSARSARSEEVLGRRADRHHGAELGVAAPPRGWR